MTERQATIRNQQGMHCRPSAVIYKAAQAYGGHIRISSANGSSTLDSMMALIALALTPGTIVTIQVDGPDDESFCQQLVELFENVYDFPPQNDSGVTP